MTERPAPRSIECSRPHYRRSLLLAALVFSGLLAATLLISGHLVFRDLGERMRKEAISKARSRAIELAMKLAEEGAIDLYRVHQKMTMFSEYVNQVLMSERFVTAVTLYDPSGTPAGFWVERGGKVFPSSLGFHLPPQGADLTRVAAPEGLNTGPVVLVNTQETSYYAVAVPIPGAGSSRKGLVRLDIDEARLGSDIDELRRSLMIKIAAAGAICVLLLLIAFAFVVRLLAKTRRLEAEAQMADRLAYVGTLASGLAHEIRNPLNAMNMNLQMLEEEISSARLHADPEAAGLLASTKGEIRRLENLVNDFLSYARPSEPRFETRDVNRTVDEVVRFLRADLHQKGIGIDIDLREPLPTVEIDEGQIRQALMNILINAKDILGPGGQIRVATGLGAEGEITVRIQDNGPGIPQELRHKIFEVFYSTRGGGTGLGLPIAQKILETHGGWIELQTEVGKGTTFVLHMPQSPRVEGKPAPAVAHAG